MAERHHIVSKYKNKKLYVYQIHELYGHIGVYKCRKIFGEAFWVPEVRRFIAKLLRVCDSCQRNKVYTRANEIITAPIIPADPSLRDAVTKFVKLYPMRKADTRTTIRRIFEDNISNL